jgi:GAF domain-containing protein
MAMHVTTVRFGDELWEQLDREATREGVSVAQYVRDAALLRIATVAERRGDERQLVSLAELVERPARRRTPEVARDPARVAAVRATGLLDVTEHPGLDRLTDLTRRVLNAPIALVSLIDDEKQHMVSSPGVPAGRAGRDIPLSHSVCRKVVERREPLVISDTRDDPQLRDVDLPASAGVVAYVGAPLITADGHAIGSLCATDERPRHWTGEQVEMLTTLAQSVVTEIERAPAG